MTEETITYTEEDLRDAMHTRFVDNDPNPASQKFTDQTPLKDRIWCYEAGMTVLDLERKEDRTYFREHVLPESQERYLRGQEILKTCDIIASSRSTCLGDNQYDKMVEGETVVSPVLRWPSGYVATSEAYCWIALALRKGASHGRSVRS